MTEPKQPKPAETHPVADERYLCFRLGKERYAIPLLAVREVIAPPDTTPVPHAPPYFVGIMNLRGQVISVMDLRTKLGIKPDQSAETAIIIFDFHPNSVGVVVDSIDSVINASPEDVVDKPELQNNKAADSILGVFRSQDGLVLLIDVAKTLNLADQRLIASAAA